MTYKVIWLPKAKKDLQLHTNAGNINLLKKINTLETELTINPRKGTGKPKRLKYYKWKEVWSRKIDEKHRMIYIIEDKLITVTILSAYNHYGEK